MLFSHESERDSISNRTVEEIGDDGVGKVLSRFLEALEQSYQSVLIRSVNTDNGERKRLYLLRAKEYCRYEPRPCLP